MYLIDTNIWLELLLDQVNTLEDNECRKLDFDDAYQYFAARKAGIKIISFDKDFDKTKLGKETPGEIK